MSFFLESEHHAGSPARDVVLLDVVTNHHCRLTSESNQTSQKVKVQSLHCSQVFIHSFLHLTCKHCTPMLRVLLNLLNLDSEKRTNEWAVTGPSPCAPHATEPLSALFFILQPSNGLSQTFPILMPQLWRGSSRWAEEQQAK